MTPEELKKAIEWAKENPNDPDAKALRKRLESGILNPELKKSGMKTFEVKKPPKPQPQQISQPKQQGLGGIHGSGIQNPFTNLREKFGDIKETAQGVGSAFMGGIREGQETASDVVEGEISPLAGTAKIIGSAGLGTTSNIIGELFMGAGKLALTQEAEDEIKEIATNVGTTISETQAVKDVADWYEKQSPDTKAYIEGLGGVVALASELVGFKGGGKVLRKGVDVTTDATRRGMQGAGDFARRSIDDFISALDDLKVKRGEAVRVKNLNKVAEQTQDPLNKKGRIDLLKTTTEKGGAFKQGLLRKVKKKPDARDIERAQAVQGLVSSDPLESIVNINREIASVSQNTIRPHLRANPRTFNTKTINARLNALEKPLIFKTETSLENTYDLVRQKMLDIIQEKPKTMEGLYEARIEFDRLVKREFGDTAFNDPRRTVVRRAIQDIRREVNDFITEEIGDTVVKDALRKQHLMYEAAENIAETNNKIFGSNVYTRWAENHPNQARLLKWGAVLGGGSAIGSVAF